ncbi:ERF family protein [Anaerosinus sp.]
MNIFEKLQTMRVALQAQNLKKSGKNTYSKYDYYNLSDFLPQVNQLMVDNKVTSVITFDKEFAKLTLIDCEKPDARIEFTSPMASAQLKGVHEIQNLGAVETYQRRYLYMVAFEIVEADVLDAVQGKEPVQQQSANTNPNWCSPVGSNLFVVDCKNQPKAELERLWKFVGWDVMQLDGYIQSWAANKNIQQMNDTTYTALLKEQMSYLKNERGMSIDDSIPF